jgi:threonylcarbamoyladenosine tRNA methylthiotransferase MtaB
VSRPCEQILADARALVDNGYGEIVLTGVDIAGFRQPCSTLSDLCKSLLNDLPNLQRLRLSSLDPGVDLRPVLDIMRRDARMLPHMHLSMQSGCDTVLSRMGRRHNADMVRQITGSKISDPYVTFSWDMIFGFPGETEEEFAETLALIRELKPIRLHAFPFSPRPGTPAATMPNPVPRAESKRRVKIATDLARENMREFMESQIGKKSQVLVEQDNIGRDAHDIPVMIFPTQDFASDKSPTKPIPPRKRGGKIPDKSIVNVKLIGIADRKELTFIATI